MTWRIRLLAVIFLAGTACLGGSKGRVELSRDGFAEAFNEKFCDEWAACNSDFGCDGVGTGTAGTTSCDFDAVAAQDCIDGDWVCDHTSESVPFVLVPDECTQVFRCGGGSG